MKTLSAMQVRKNLGAVLDEVRQTATPVMLERAGKPLAMLCPLPATGALTPSPASRRSLLERLAGLGRATPRAENLDVWLRHERDAWGG